MNTLDDRVQAARERLENVVDSEPPTLARARRASRRRRTMSVGLVAATLVAAATGVFVATRGNERTSVVAGPTTGGDRLAHLQQPGMWTLLPEAPISGRFDGAGVWTGSEFLIWGGANGDHDLADGAAYNPVTQQWRTLAQSPLTARADAAAVWTGSELVIWGGGANGTPLNDAAAYDPAHDTWRRLAASPLPGAIRPATVWTGREMIVLGGLNAGAKAAAYDPATDTWREITGAPGGIVPPYPQAVWTGEHAVFLVESSPLGQALIATYDPGSDQWTVLPDSGAQQAKLFWTGSELLAIDPTSGGTSALFDVAAHAWHPVAATPANAAISPEQVWTGTAALFWGVSRSDAAGSPSAAVLDPTAGSWELSEPFAPLRTRVDGMIVWADGVMLAWGGFANAADGSAIGLADGVIYRPKPIAASTPPTPTTNDPGEGAPLVACGSHPYPTPALEGPPGAETDQDAAADALRDALAQAAPGTLPATGWRRLLDDGTVVVFGSGEFGPGANPVAGAIYEIVFRKDGATYRFEQSSSCVPRVHVADRSLATFVLAPGETLTPESTEIEVAVTELACTGATPVNDRLGTPQIRYTDTAVEVLYTAVPLEGGAFTCPGNPSANVTLRLREPLGDRRLLDASTYPARDATVGS